MSPFAPHPFLQKSQKQKRIPKTPRSTPDLPEKPHIGSQERVVLKAKSIAIESPKRTQNPLRFPQTNPHLATPHQPKGCSGLAVLTAGWYNTLLPALEMSGAVGSVVRAPRSHRGGRWFKSITAHHSDAAMGPRWRNGRRAAFRAQCPYGRVGSNPTLGTKVYQALVAQQDRAQPCEG